MRRRNFRLFACEFRFVIACTVEEEREKNEKKHFTSSTCFYFQRHAPPLLRPQTMHLLTIERIFVSLKNNLSALLSFSLSRSLVYSRIETFKSLSRSTYMYVHIYRKYRSALDTGSQPFAFETNTRTRVQDPRM